MIARTAPTTSRIIPITHSKWSFSRNPATSRMIPKMIMASTLSPFGATLWAGRLVFDRPSGCSTVIPVQHPEGGAATPPSGYCLANGRAVGDPDHRGDCRRLRRGGEGLGQHVRSV